MSDSIAISMTSEIDGDSVLKDFLAEPRGTHANHAAALLVTVTAQRNNTRYVKNRNKHKKQLLKKETKKK